MDKIGIVVIAVNISDNIKNRFLEFLNKSTDITTVVNLVTEEDGDFFTNGIFNKSKALNFGIKQLINECSVIIQTDIDMIIPPGLISKTFELCTSHDCHIFSRCCNCDKIVNNWEYYKNLELREAGYGAWNALAVKSWLDIGGFNEDLYGWGGEDDDLHNRIKRANIPTIILTEYPLVHINHDKRTINRSLENFHIRKNFQKTNWLSTEKEIIRKTVICTASTAMGIGDGVMMIPAVVNLSKKYNVRVISTAQSYNILKHFDNGNNIRVFNMETQGSFYTNDHIRSYNLIYWDIYNSLRQFPHHAINMIMKYADLPIYTIENKQELIPIPIDPKIDHSVKLFMESLKKPVILTQPLVSYYNKMLDPNKYHKLLDKLTKIGTVIQIGGPVSSNLIHQRSLNFVDKTSLEQSLAMIKYADVVFSGDSFLQHAAAALKTPCVVYFCGTHPFEFGYPFHANICHDKDVPCQKKCARPLRWLFDYDYKNKDQWNTRNEIGWVCPVKFCEKIITVDEIIEAILTQITIGRARDWSFHDLEYSSWLNDPAFKV